MNLRRVALSWKLWTLFAVVAGAFVIRTRSARARRQAPVPPRAARPAAVPVASNTVPHATPTARVAPVRNAIAPDRGLRRHHRNASEHVAPSRRLPRSVVAGGIALLAIAPGIFLARPAVRHAFPTLTAEAADTPDGLVFNVQGSGFAPNSDVWFSWHHPEMDGVRARSSASGDVQATVPMPSTSVTEMAAIDGTVDLVATDGAATATQPVAVTAAATGAQSDARVTVDGGQYFLVGANYPWVNYGNDFGSNAWGAYGVHTGGPSSGDLHDMSAQGAHVVRWWVFADGRAGINFSPDGTPTGVQQSVYEDLDRAVTEARQNNVYLDLVLFDFSLFNKEGWYGGVQLGGHSDLISDPAKRAALVNNVIRPLAERYGAEPSIAAWELMNEPEFALSDLPQPAVNSGLVPVTMRDFWSYASAASQMFHLHSQTPVTIGSASLKWNAVWTDAFATGHGLSPIHLDFYETHYYPWMDGWTINDPALGQTTMSPLTQPVSGLHLDKPIVVGEAYMPPGSGKSTLDTVLNNGYAGLLGWSYNTAKTGDGITMDWAALRAWDNAHAAITHIAAAPVAPTATVTATHTPRPATATATDTATATKTVRGTNTATATATNTRAATSTPTAGTKVDAVPTPGVNLPTGEGPTAIATSTSTRAPAPSPTSAPTATPTPGGGGGGFDAQYCATKIDVNGHSQCGNPPNFCDGWAGGHCNDYRTTQLAPGAERPLGSVASDAVSVDCLGSTDAGQVASLPYYDPSDMNEWPGPGHETIPLPCGFASMEHFMTRIEDGQFGMVVMRQQYPFDFAGRTGHIHFDVDMKTLERRYARVVLSPDLTKVGIDDRHMLPVADQALDIWFRNGTFQGRITNGNSVSDDIVNSCNGCGARYYGTDNARDSVDVYVSRTHLRILVNGQTEVDKDIPDIGFDRAYVYLEHVNYNSCKAFEIEGYATIAECQLAGNTFHWDNVAFDGPSLPRNGLTPAGSEDVAFNAFGQASCKVKGVAAMSPEPSQYLWTSWVARLPAGTAVSPSDVVCTPSSNGGQWYRGTPMGFEVVQQ
ncbi:MAG TPA: hypothetical protein VFY79_00420 [Dehalococcoidia bacterium]|nr:hypothetical protein [Dehalococcoidia bacterium]